MSSTWELVPEGRVFTEDYVDVAKVIRSAAKRPNQPGDRCVLRWVRSWRQGLVSPYIKRQLALVVDEEVKFVARQNARGAVYWDNPQGSYRVEHGPDERAV